MHKKSGFRRLLVRAADPDINRGTTVAGHPDINRDVSTNYRQ